MKPSLSILTISLFALTACVDTTGLSAESSKPVHPETNANASVSVVEYGDLQCPSCRGALEQIVKPMIEKYGSQIRFEFRQFPLASIHQYAMAAAEASECAADQGKFWEFVDMNYENQDKLSTSAIKDWGSVLGLDMSLFDRCQKSHIKRDAILAEYKQGDALGVDGTPTFFVNGIKIKSIPAEISKAIEDAAGSFGTKL